ncbi:hypothetical protein MC885_009737 [Smutsia gigantea]|nr:hypothetical protein MC885_009737 [Smutsia gigantea]
MTVSHFCPSFSLIAFITPAMKYEKRNTNSFLICSVLGVYPHPIIIWQVDNTPTSESSMEETGSLGPFYVNSRINITGSNSSYECAIENSLLEQTWTGRWTMKDGLHKMQSEKFSLSCELVNSVFLLNQEFIVTWSRAESGTSSILAYFLSSSQNTVINEPRLSWKGELINQSDFSLTLKDLSLSDSGEYLCNISSSKYTSLTVQTLHVGSHNGDIETRRTESKDTCPDNYSVFAFGGFGFAGSLHGLSRDDTFTAAQDKYELS